MAPQGDRPRPVGESGQPRTSLPLGGEPAQGAPLRPPVPWHFKLVCAFAALYIVLRIVQMLGWAGVSVKDLHNVLALVIAAVNLAAAVWCLVLWKRGRPLSRAPLSLALAGWYLYVPQLALGIALYATKHRAPTGWQHYIYGIGAVLVMSVGGFYRRRLQGREALVVGLASLLLTGVAVRAFITGHG